MSVTIDTMDGPRRVSRSAARSSGNGLPVLFCERTTNRKLAPVEWVPAPETTRGKRPVPRPPFCSATYTSIAATCPQGCAFRNAGCFAQAGFSGHLMRNLDAAASRLGPMDVTRIEAAVIREHARAGVRQDGARGGRDLRLHIGGDVGGGERGASELGNAASAWRIGGGGVVWTYTHKWRRIHPTAWGAVEALASVESESEAAEALRAGYAPALTVPAFPLETERAFDLGGIRMVPCPAQTRGTTCVKCRLCFDVGRLKRHETGIAFAVHGPAARKARARLAVLR